MTDDRVQQRIDTAMAELSVYERKVGSFSKPYAFVCAKEMKPSAWWAMFGKYVQMISSIAQRVLPQPVVRGRCGDKYNRSIYGSIKMVTRWSMSTRCPGSCRRGRRHITSRPLQLGMKVVTRKPTKKT